MQTSISKTNCLFDSIFEPTRNSPSTFLINDNKEISYIDFHIMINQLANVLIKKGMRVGDRVAVQAEKSNTQIALYAATIKAGGVYLPLNTGYTSSELDYFIKDSSAKIIIVDKDVENIIAKNLEVNTVLLTLSSDETGSLTALAEEQETFFDTVERGPDDLAAILYTSGTTGKSKGAILAYVGGSMIFLPKFDIEQALKWMNKSTTMMGVPTFYTRLLSDSRFNHSLTKHMRLFISGSAPLLAETHKEFEDRTSKKILERYGMTETNMSTSNPYDNERIAGTVGLPLPGIQLRIADDKGNEVEQGQIGIIELKGENVFKGYWQMPGKTSESFREDGFFITGDMAKVDKNGYVTIVGRDKDLIISGGLNIYPKEVETIIDEIESIEESAVFASPHKDFGEAVVAAVVRKNEAIIETEIINYLSDKLAKFKQPKKIIFLDSLPRNAMGKVQKAELRKKYQKLFND
jgi:malonyl-CoA/methylmalonyl-CoA synthetase